MGIDGTMFDTEKGEKRPKVNVPKMPLHNSESDSKF